MIGCTYQQTWALPNKTQRCWVSVLAPGPKGSVSPSNFFSYIFWANWTLTHGYKVAYKRKKASKLCPLYILEIYAVNFILMGQKELQNLSSLGEKQAAEQNWMMLALKVRVSTYTDRYVCSRKFGRGLPQTSIWERNVSGLCKENFSSFLFLTG